MALPPSPTSPPSPRPASRVAADAVQDLIVRATAHPLGVSFLLQGAHDAVAATFGVHAFTVDAARERLTPARRVAPLRPPSF